MKPKDGEDYESYSKRMQMASMQRHPNPYCHPADTTGPVWLMLFEDQDRQKCVYHDEAEALQAFAKAESLGWNCLLFTSVPRIVAEKYAR